MPALFIQPQSLDRGQPFGYVLAKNIQSLGDMHSGLVTGKSEQGSSVFVGVTVGVTVVVGVGVGVGHSTPSTLVLPDSV